MSEARNQLPRNPVIPDKLYFRIGEVARLLGVETHTLRFWETEFPQLKVGKGGTGQRLYRRRDVELVVEIKHLLYEQGYTIPGARQFLQNRQRRGNHTAAPLGATPGHDSKPAPGRDSRPAPSLENIRAELRDLSALLTETGPSERPASRAGLRERGRSGPEGQRRGLHLAARPPGRHASRPSANTPSPRALPGLFDPDPE